MIRERMSRNKIKQRVDSFVRRLKVEHEDVNGKQFKQVARGSWRRGHFIEISGAVPRDPQR